MALMKQVLSVCLMMIPLCLRGATFPNRFTTNADGTLINGSVLYGNGGGFTNVTSMYGQPRNIINGLPHFWTNLNNGGPIRWLNITDLGGFPGGQEAINSFNGLCGYNGTSGFGFGGSTGSPRIDNSAGVTPVQDLNTFPFAFLLTPLTPGDTMTLSRRTSVGSPLIQDTNFLSDTVKASWISDNNGGTVFLETSTAGGAWTTIKTLNSFVTGNTNAASTNVSVTLGYNSVRFRGNAGTTRCVTLGLENSTSNNFYYSELGIQGLSLTQIVAVPTAYYYSVFTNLNPSLITVQDMDVAQTPPYWQTVITWLTNTMSAADIIDANNHLTEGTGNDAYNAQAYTNAVLLGFDYWDTAFYFGTNMQLLTNLFLLNFNDTAHFSASGTSLANNLFWNDNIQPKIDAYVNGGFTSSKFQGNYANLFNNTRTDSLGIGVVPATTGQGRLSVKTAVGSSTFVIDDVGGSGSIWFDANARTAGNYMFQRSQDGSVLNLNLGSGGGLMQFASQNSPKMTMFASGGLIVGLSAADPGANNLGVSGIVYVTNCFNGSGNQITNTGVTISTNATAPVTPGTIAAWMNVTNQQGKVGKIPVYY